MIFWPFGRRRNRRASKQRTRSRSPLAEKAPALQSAASDPTTRRGSRRTSWRSISARQEKAVETGTSAPRRQSRQQFSPPSSPRPRHPYAGGKENTRRANDSHENITALPVSSPLQSSPHLRPVDLEKPHIPYQFRPPDASETHVPVHGADIRSRSHTLTSKRSNVDNGPPSRTGSKASRKSRRQNDALREEQIRAMSAAIPIPKRPGGDNFHRESMKMRGLASRGSAVSLPPEGSIHSAMSGFLEQRGWEIGGLSLSPRPALRISGSPQFIAPGPVATSSGFLYRIDSIRAKDKTPVTEKERKRRTIGQDTANDLDTGEIRAILERDAKRKARKEQERHERLERKLQSRASERERQQKREERSELQAELAKLRAEQGLLDQSPLTPPAEVHPALRESPFVDTTPAEKPKETAQTIEDAAIAPASNPFTDAAALTQRAASPSSPRPFHTPLDTPIEIPALEGLTEAELAKSQTQTPTPPISPIRSPTSFASESRLSRAYRKSSLSQTSGPRSPVGSPTESNPDRKLGSWTGFFRRGNTTARRAALEKQLPTSQTSFSNTSRESMKAQNIPAHFMEGQVRRPSAASGAPTRTQSRFREDLPESPLSPPDSRTQSPFPDSTSQATDITTLAAEVAAARRAKRAQAAAEAGTTSRTGSRSDTPVSPIVRNNSILAESVAPVGGEGSWLAGGDNARKRQSNQSAISRSLSKRNNDFNASYESLPAGAGADKDAEYLIRNNLRLASTSHIDTIPDESAVVDDDITDPTITIPDDSTITTDAPLTVHDSVRRKPTLVHRDPVVRSREGLLAEFDSAASTPGVTAAKSVRTEGSGSGSQQDSDEFEQDVALQNAVSVRTVASRHSRQFSAGSAKLLDVARRQSVGAGSALAMEKSSVPDVAAEARRASEVVASSAVDTEAPVAEATASQAHQPSDKIA